MLSVIICTYNRQKYIYNCLHSIANNTLETKQYEIVLINNNSTDNTEAECNRFCTDYPQVRFNYFVETNQGLSYARNRGIAEAKGEVLVYVDDDAVVSKDYLLTVARFFAATPDAMATGGAIYPVYETEEPEWMSVYTKALITAYKDEGSKIVRLRGSKFPSGGNAAYRREVFDRVGLFDTELGRKGTSLISGEEKAIFDKMKKLDMPIYYLPDMILYHIIPPSKLTKEYFDNLTLSIGKSEKLRTLSVSRAAYAKRIVEEIVKWVASILLCLGFCLQLSPGKGIKLLQFRFNVSKGLIAG